MPAAIATPWGERGNGQERMIGQLTGTLLEKNPPEVLLDCHGVGYEVQVPMSTFYNLPALGQPVSLLTQFIVREDAQLLYGFATPAERQAFRELIKIAGVGPRRAVRALGHGRGRAGAGRDAQEPGAWSRCPASARRPPSACCWS
jgi:Holliday junction DNA helicase RuvA